LQTSPLTIKAGGNIGLEIVEKSLSPRQAADSDELFIAVTTRDIVSVVKFNDTTIGDGKPGKYTKQLAREFLSFTV